MVEELLKWNTKLKLDSLGTGAMKIQYGGGFWRSFCLLDWSCSKKRPHPTAAGPRL
jgi:hypothetical protein